MLATTWYAALFPAFVLGLSASFGPCAVPRMLAILQTPRPTLWTACEFALGTMLTYAGFACGGDLLLRAVGNTASIDGVLAAALILFGIAALLGEPNHCGSRTGSSGAFGISTSLVLSPCCLPGIAVCLAWGARFGTAEAALDVAAFALGQLVPVLLLAAGNGAVRRVLHGQVWREAAHVAAAIFSILLGGYYAVLWV